jgi:MtrB/PioB family decaheme-associated outer membrane protein
MNKLIRLVTAAALAFLNTPAIAAVKQEVDVKFQQRFQKTVDGAPSAIPTEYGEIPNGFILDRYLLDYDSENYVIEVEAANVNLNNQYFRFEGGAPGKMTWKAVWDEMPHLFSNEARTPYTYQGSGVMVLPGAWRDGTMTTASYAAGSPSSAVQTAANARFNAGISTALAGAPYAPLGFAVNTGKVDLKFHPAHDFTVDVGAWRQTKKGTKPQPAAFGFSNAVELAAPIDWATNEAYLEMQLAKKAYQLAFNYRLSHFNNNIPQLSWDNPKRFSDQYTNNAYSQGDQSARGALANAPSNQAHSLKLEGGVNLPMNSRFSAEAGYQRWTALNEMMAYTVNSAITPTALAPAADKPSFDASALSSRPDANVNGLIEVYTYMGKLSSRPLSWLRTALSHEAYIMENRSTQYNVPGWAVFDQGWHNETTRTPREQIRDDKTALKLDYDITDWLSGDLGAKHVYKKLTREIPKLREYEGTTGLTFRPMSGVWGNLSYLAAFRRGNGMDFEHYPKTVDTGGSTWFTEAPGMRRPDLADRNRHQGRLQVQWTADEATVGLSARMTDDRYRQGKGDLNGYDPRIFPNLFGTISDRQEAVGVDVSVPLPGSLTVDSYYEYDRSNRMLRSAQTQAANTCGGTGTTYIMCQSPASTWETRLTENAHIAGLQLTWVGIEKLKTVFGYDITYTRFNGDPTSAGANIVNYRPFETSRRMLQTFKARGEYKVLKDLTLAANYAYEKFDASDFAYKDVQIRPPGNASIFLGANPIRNYYAHTVGAGLNYKF